MSFYPDLLVARGSRSDWKHFSKWHYRGHSIGPTLECFLLLHDGERVGFISFSPPALTNAARNRIFGKKRWTGQQINRYFVTLSRVVLDPRYRGAGLMGDFLSVALRRIKPVRYCEALMAMGAVTGYWRKAGLRDYGPTQGSKTIKAGWAFRGDLGGRPAAGTEARRGQKQSVWGEGNASVKSLTQSALSQIRYYLIDLRTIRDDVQ